MRDRLLLGITLPTIDTLALLKCSGLPSCHSIVILWIWQLFFATSCFLSQSKGIAAENCGERFELDRRPSRWDQRHDLHKVLSRQILMLYIYYHHHEYHHPYLLYWIHCNYDDEYEKSSIRMDSGLLLSLLEPVAAEYCNQTVNFSRMMIMIIAMITRRMIMIK